MSPEPVGDRYGALPPIDIILSLASRFELWTTYARRDGIGEDPAAFAVIDEYALIGKALRALATTDGAVVRVPEGWMLVPTVPTAEMAQAAIWALDRARELDGKLQDPRPYTAAQKHAIRYVAMLGAAPPAPAEASDWLVWSNEHGAWWRPGRAGYSRLMDQAGFYSKQEADEICARAGSHAGRPNEVAVLAPTARQGE